MEKGPETVVVAAERLQRIKDEIKHYPTPIAGCDDQFKFLLSERDRLTQELREIRN